MDRNLPQAVMHHHTNVFLGIPIAVTPSSSRESVALQDLEMVSNALGPAATPASELLQKLPQMDPEARALIPVIVKASQAFTSSGCQIAL